MSIGPRLGYAHAPDDPGPVINLDELKFYHRPMHLFDDWMNILTGLLGGMIIMVPVRWIYVAMGGGKSVNPGVASGLFVLPMVVTAIIDIVQFSLALAFALAGVSAGVRYRTTLKNLSDAFFTFVAIAVGLAAGTRPLGIGLIILAIITLIFRWLWNTTMPDVFGINSLTFGQAAG